MDPQRELVFVYGTLRRGGSNHFRMDGADPIGAATVQGRLYRIDWYPGLVLDPGGVPIAGEVFAVSTDQLQALDLFEGLSAGEIEGTEYRRVKATVILAAGGTADAWIWEWRGPADRYPLIGGGDWLAGA